MAPEHPPRRRGRSARARLKLVIACVAALLAAATARADAALDAERALELARTLWFEGIPDEEIAPLSADAVAALADLLDDPEEARAHANAIDLLGLAGGPGAYEAVADFAAHEPSGELSSGAYLARLAVPLALGRLAHTDDRALADLLAELARDGGRDFHYRHIDPARMDRLLRFNAVTGLALARRPQARTSLAAIARGEDAGVDPALRYHALEMLEEVP